MVIKEECNSDTVKEEIGAITNQGVGVRTVQDVSPYVYKPGENVYLGTQHGYSPGSERNVKESLAYSRTSPLQ